MRWSKFKNKDAQYMFDVMSQRVFPAIKGMRGGRLPDFDEEKGTFVPLPDVDDGTAQAAFAHFMKGRRISHAHAAGAGKGRHRAGRTV